MFAPWLPQVLQNVLQGDSLPDGTHFYKLFLTRRLPEASWRNDKHLVGFEQSAFQL